MTEHKLRLFPTADAVSRVGEGLIALTLPREEWTHEAHLAATAYLILLRPEIDLDAKLRHLTSSYNESVGGTNSDSADGWDSGPDGGGTADDETGGTLGFGFGNDAGLNGRGCNCEVGSSQEPWAPLGVLGLGLFGLSTLLRRRE